MARRMFARALSYGPAWAVADQAMSAAANFAVAIIVARGVGAEEFGDFTVATAVWFALLPLIRAFVTQPYVIESAPLEGRAWRRITGRAAGAVVVAGGVCGSLIAALGLVLGATLGETFAVLGACAPFLALQDFWRHAAFARSKAHQAALNSATWAAIQLAAIVMLWIAGVLTPVTAIASLGLGGAAGAAIGLFQSGTVPALSRGTLRFGRSVMPLGMWFTAAQLITALASQAAVFLVAGLAGRASVGGLRAAMNLFGPLQLLARATESFGLPSASRVLREGCTKLRLLTAEYSCLLALGGGILALPAVTHGEWLLATVFGSEFEAYASLTVPLSMWTIGAMLGAGAMIGLRACRAGKQLLAAQSAFAVVQIITVLVLLEAAGLVGAAWGIAGATAVHTVLVWILFWNVSGRVTRALAPPPRDPAGSSMTTAEEGQA